MPLNFRIISVFCLSKILFALQGAGRHRLRGRPRHGGGLRGGRVVVLASRLAVAASTVAARPTSGVLERAASGEAGSAVSARRAGSHWCRGERGCCLFGGLWCGIGSMNVPVQSAGHSAGEECAQLLSRGYTRVCFCLSSFPLSFELSWPLRWCCAPAEVVGAGAEG